MRLLTLSLLLGGVIHAAAQGNGPPKKAGIPLAAWQEVHADKGAASIYFRNDGALALIINSVTTVGCTNTREPCGEFAIDQKVQPGQVIEALQLHRLDEPKNWSFAFWFEAGKRRATAGAAVPTREPTTAAAVLAVEKLSPIEGAITTNGKCNPGITSPSLPARHRVLQMFFAADGFLASRTVTAWYDAAGAAYRYEDRRGHPDIVVSSREKGFFLRSTIRPAEPDVWIRFDLIGDNGTITTALEQGESEQPIIGPAFLTSEPLGRPGEMIARVWKECH